MGARSFQTMVPMRDGALLNTFVFLPEAAGSCWPVILHRTPYGIAAANAPHKFDHSQAGLPNPAEPMRGSILRGWQAITAHGYAAVYQDCRGRHGTEGEDRVYADDANDGCDTLNWIAGEIGRTRIGDTRKNHCATARRCDWEPIRGHHQGQRSQAPRQQAEHMTAPDHCANVNFLLAWQGPSTHGSCSRKPGPRDRHAAHRPHSAWP